MIIGFFTYTGDDALKVALREHVKTRLAGYKAPREVTFVDGFEMTSSGKINRRALREAEERIPDAP